MIVLKHMCSVILLLKIIAQNYEVLNLKKTNKKQLHAIIRHSCGYL